MTEQNIFRPLKAAVLGLDDSGLTLAELLAESDSYQLTAVADRDGETAEKAGQKYSCQHYDDYRQLVVAGKVDLLLSAAPFHSCKDLLRTALEAGIHVLKAGPAGLSFEHTAELIKAAKKGNVRYHVISPWLCSDTFKQLKQLICPEQTENRTSPDDPSSSQTYMIHAQCSLMEDKSQPETRWLCDPSLAGGGVLLRHCYELIGQIVELFSMPQQVYALTMNNAPDKQQRLSTTEDTVLMTMAFSDTLSASLTGNRLCGPPKKQLIIHTSEKYIELSQPSLTIRSCQGELLEQKTTSQTEKQLTAEFLQNFAQAVLNPDKPFIVSPRAELETMAVIEAAYLSARTAMPETPAKLIEMIKAD